MTSDVTKATNFECSERRQAASGRYADAAIQRRVLTSDVEDGLARDLSELVAGAQLVLAGVLRLHVVDEQHHDAVVVADVVASRRLDLTSGGRPRQSRRRIRFQTSFQPATHVRYSNSIRSVCCGRTCRCMTNRTSGV